MSSPVVEKITADLQARGTELVLDSDALTDECWAELKRRAEVFQSVESVQCKRLSNFRLAPFVAFVTQLPALRALSCSSLTDAEVVHIAGKLKMLTDLDLSHCHHVTDVGAAALANNLHKLTKLKVERAWVTDVGVAALADKLTHLTELSLYGCQKLTDVALALLLMRNDPLYIPFVVAFAKVVGLVLFGRSVAQRKQRRQGTPHE
jgi:hypothetical protein